MYADGLSVHKVLAEAIPALQSHLQSIINWCKKRRMLIYLMKLVILHFTRQKKQWSNWHLEMWPCHTEIVDGFCVCRSCSGPVQGSIGTTSLWLAKCITLRWQLESENSVKFLAFLRQIHSHIHMCQLLVTLIPAISYSLYIIHRRSPVYPHMDSTLSDHLHIQDNWWIQF